MDDLNAGEPLSAPFPAIAMAGALLPSERAAETISRTASPALSLDGNDLGSDKRSRPRTFDYSAHLPYQVEDDAARDHALDVIIRNLHIAIAAEDFSPGALHWTRELQGWLSFKFDMPRAKRACLARLYYHLALAPGLESPTTDRFVRMLINLTRKKHYLKPVDELVLDWRPLWKQLKGIALPNETSVHQAIHARVYKQVLRLCLHAQAYLDPSERRSMLDEILPYFSTMDMSNAFIVIGLLTAMVPTTPAPATAVQSQPSDFLPTYFHLWSLVSRSKAVDISFVDIFGRMARDYLACTHVPFTAHGIFTPAQSSLVFTAILRLTEIPVNKSISPYVGSLDYSSGLAAVLDKDRKKYPVPFMAAQWIGYSLSPHCLDDISGDDDAASPTRTILVGLESFLQSVETFAHPSNHGAWSLFLAQFASQLADVIVYRWNREQSGELDIPSDRRITPALRRRVVLALRDITFMGLYSKSAKVAGYYYITLQKLAYLEPKLILPGALQRFCPMLDPSEKVEEHRMTSAMCSLQYLAPIMARQKGFRCFLTSLLGVAPESIDINDPVKTQNVLNFIQSVAYSIPLVPLVEDGQVTDSSLAKEWIEGQVVRLASEGPTVAIDYDAELSDEREALLARSSTGDLAVFVVGLLDKIFTIFENLPTAVRARAGSDEDNVINSIPAAMTPLFAALSPAIFDIALDKLAKFASSHVVHQARDAMAWICSALCKVNPAKALRVFVPMLIANIRNEIEHNGAASDRSSGIEVLPRDRGLVWNVSILSMCVVHVGGEVVAYRDELLGIARFMQERCRGLPTIHISNFVHHLLLNLTSTYPVDHAMFEPAVVAGGLGIEHWGRVTPPAELTIRWYRPRAAELQFAVDLFESQVVSAMQKIEALMADDPPVSRTGKNKEWSDEMSRSLYLIRYAVSGASAIFYPARASTTKSGPLANDTSDTPTEEDPLAEIAADDELQRELFYPYGYNLDSSSAAFEHIHELRERIGYLLRRTHEFLTTKQEDDVTCFNALYATFRTWITDVGVERTAHTLERHLRLYRSDISSFRMSGLRKAYPRSMLIKRADAYQLQRVKYNAAFRLMSPLDRLLLQSLAESCTSLYADVRRTAQSAQEASLKVLVGGRAQVIPIVLQTLASALATTDHDRIKGAMYTLLFSSLIRTIQRDWRFAPTLLRLYIQTAAVDKASIQRLVSTAVFSLINFGKPFELMVVCDPAVVASISPSIASPGDDADDADKIARRHAFILERRSKVEAKKHELGLELVEVVRTAHWKIAGRCSMFALNMLTRFDTMAPPELIRLVVEGSVSQHPTLRNAFQGALSVLFMQLSSRAGYNHDYRRQLLDEESSPNRVEIMVPPGGGDAAWTQQYLDSFAAGESESPSGPCSSVYIDYDYPGWLVWGTSFHGYRMDPVVDGRYDALETGVRRQIGALITRDWCRQFFDFMKQEPRDAASDRFRLGYVSVLERVFDLVHAGLTLVTFDEVKALVLEVYGDGSDKHQHRATAEILAGLLSAGPDESKAYRDDAWAFAGPLLVGVIKDRLTPDNVNYWARCVHTLTSLRDPRRVHELAAALAAFRLDMTSDAAFKDSSQVTLLEYLVSEAGWHFRGEAPVVEDLLAHLDHPYKAVRESIGRLLATTFRTRYHESFANVTALLDANKSASSVGLRPYVPTAAFSDMVATTFARLEAWRHERQPGQREQSRYTAGCKTVLVWLDCMLSSQECTQLVPYFAEPFLDQLLHMIDVKEDPDLSHLAVRVYRHLPNIPLRDGEDEAFVRKLTSVGRTAQSWHQRQSALRNIQVVYFRRLFLTSPAQRQLIFDAVGDMLNDAQTEVRETAAETLAGMIRCSPAAVRNPIVRALKLRFREQLKANPRVAWGVGGGAGGEAGAGADLTPDARAALQRQIVRRHAAVLGLGALLAAFPYVTPLPKWMPNTLSFLAKRAGQDRDFIAKTVSNITKSFHDKRVDTKEFDRKSFTEAQAQNIDGMKTASYIA